MMISPDGFIMQNKDKSYEELLPLSIPDRISEGEGENNS